MKVSLQDYKSKISTFVNFHAPVLGSGWGGVYKKAKLSSQSKKIEKKMIQR